MTSEVGGTLIDRGKMYGRYEKQAEVSQRIKQAMGSHPGWHRLAYDQRESLEMIANKIGRIINGDPNYSDSWHDIAGYAKLVDDRLNGIDSNTGKSASAQVAAPPAIKTWHAVPLNEFGVPIPELTEVGVSFGGTD